MSAEPNSGQLNPLNPAVYEVQRPKHFSSDSLLSILDSTASIIAFPDLGGLVCRSLACIFH